MIGSTIQGVIIPESLQEAVGLEPRGACFLDGIQFPSQDNRESLSLIGRVNPILSWSCARSTLSITALVVAAVASIVYCLRGQILDYLIESHYSKLAALLIGVFSNSVFDEDEYGYTLLYKAALRGDLLVLAALSELADWTRFSEITPEDIEQYTDQTDSIEFLYSHALSEGSALEIAILQGHLDIVKYLTVRGALFDARLLSLVISTGNTELVKYLVEEQGLDILEEDERGNTPVHHAAIRGQLEILRYFVEEREVDLNMTNAYGMTLLHSASLGNQTDLMRYLLSRADCQPDAQDNQQRTALHLATETWDEDSVQVLIEANVRQDLCDNEGFTALERAIEGGDLPTFKMLFSQDIVTQEDKNKALFKTVHFGHQEMLAWLLEQEGIDANQRDIRGKTALILATLRQQAGIVTVLLEHNGIDVNARDHLGRTALHLAAEQGDLVILEALLSTGNIDVNCESGAFGYPVHCAVLGAHVDILQRLLQVENIATNATAFNGMTALHTAVEIRDLPSLYLLVAELSSDVLNQLDSNGKTALYRAAEEGYHRVIEILLQGRGIDPHICGPSGMTPLQVALENRHTVSAAWFLSLHT